MSTNHVPFPIISKQNSNKKHILRNENTKFLIDGFYRKTIRNNIFHQQYANLQPEIDSGLDAITFYLFNHELFSVNTL